jgi:hypothetical protein
MAEASFCGEAVLAPLGFSAGVAGVIVCPGGAAATGRAFDDERLFATLFEGGDWGDMLHSSTAILYFGNPFRYFSCAIASGAFKNPRMRHFVTKSQKNRANWRVLYLLMRTVKTVGTTNRAVIGPAIRQNSELVLMPFMVSPRY